MNKGEVEKFVDGIDEEEEKRQISLEAMTQKLKDDSIRLATESRVWSRLGPAIQSLKEMREYWDDVEFPYTRWTSDLSEMVHSFGEEFDKLRRRQPDCKDLGEQYDSALNDHRNEVFRLGKETKRTIRILREITRVGQRIEKAQNDKEAAYRLIDEIVSSAQSFLDESSHIYLPAWHKFVSQALNLHSTIVAGLRLRISVYNELLDYQCSREEQLKRWVKVLRARLVELHKLTEHSHEWKEDNSIILTTHPGRTPRAEGSSSKRRKPTQKTVVTYICGKCGKALSSEI